MERNWSGRAYKEGDEERILELWKAVNPKIDYDREKWLSWWRWKFKNNATGSSVIWVAEHDGDIVGQYAIIPVKVKIGVKILDIFQSVDTLTHPSYRRKGIFITLADAVFHQIEGNDADIVFGFANKESLPGFVTRLDFAKIADLPLIIKPLNWHKSLSQHIRNKFLLGLCQKSGTLLQNLFWKTRPCPVIEGLRITQVDSFDERVNDLWNRVSNQYKIAVVRNKDYLNWRYVIPSAVDYPIFIAEKGERIVGYIVMRCRQERAVKTGVIFDIIAESEKFAKCLAAEAVEYFKRENVDIIYTVMKTNNTYQKALRWNGFIRLPFVKSITLIARTGPGGSYAKEYLREYQNWFVEIGDSDLT